MGFVCSSLATLLSSPEALWQVASICSKLVDEISIGCMYALFLIAAVFLNSLCVCVCVCVLTVFSLMCMGETPHLTVCCSHDSYKIWVQRYWYRVWFKFLRRKLIAVVVLFENLIAVVSNRRNSPCLKYCYPFKVVWSSSPRGIY